MKTPPLRTHHQRRHAAPLVALALAAASAPACTKSARPSAVETSRPAQQSTVPRGAPPPTAAESCRAVMLQTRRCQQVYVPGLLALRVRLDQPSGIAARYDAEGEDALLELAHSQFARDWSDGAIAENCDALSREPPAEQERIIRPERECLDENDCSAFTRCDLAHKERRWSSTL